MSMVHPAGCPSSIDGTSTHRYGSTCYWRSSNTFTYPNAKAYCNSQDGRPAILDTDEKQDFMQGIHASGSEYACICVVISLITWTELSVHMEI